MRRSRLLLGSLALLVCAPAAAQTRILPLGDSITQGGQGYASWRYPLWFALVQAGYSVDFVGSRDFVFGGAPDPGLYPGYATAFDRDHEGYWGWRTDQIAPIAQGLASAAQPDFALIHLGTNDVGQMGAAGVANADTNLRLIVQALRAAVPDVAILLARVVPIGPGSSYSVNAAQVAALNAVVDDVAADLDSPASPVVVVDQNAGYDLDTLMQPDGLHPDAEGEAQIARRWLAALAPRLPPPDPNAPIPVSNPSFEAPALADGALASGPGTFGGWSFAGTANTWVGIFDPPVGEFRDATASVSSGGLDPGLLGQPLAIRLSLVGSEAPRSTHFDDVRLARSETSVVPALPAPAAALLALGLLAAAR